MNQKEIILHFQSNYAEIKETILKVAVWANKPNKDVCAEIAAGLLHLAEKKDDKNAAALYCLIAAFGHTPDVFPKNIACRIIFDLNALETYHKLVDDELFMILDDDDNLYSYVYNFPVTHRHTLQNKPNSPGSPSTIEWQGRTVRLGRPFEWNGRTLIVYREVNDEKYGQVLIAALNSSKDYIIGDSVVTDQAIIDYLDDNYGLPVKWRKIKF